jgi:16S rRNA (cytidine1402-2'-O)-methyltransferase
MEGFVPRKAGEKDELFRTWQTERRTIVFYESPQRIATTLADMTELLSTRRIAICRELTKLHEEVLRGTVANLAETLAGREVLGEIVVVLEGSTDEIVVSGDDVREALLAQLSDGISTRDAVSFVADTLGVAHRDVYQMALEVKKSIATS